MLLALFIVSRMPSLPISVKSSSGFFTGLTGRSSSRPLVETSLFSNCDWAFFASARFKAICSFMDNLGVGGTTGSSTSCFVGDFALGRAGVARSLDGPPSRTDKVLVGDDGARTGVRSEVEDLGFARRDIFWLWWSKTKLSVV